LRFFLHGIRKPSLPGAFFFVKFLTKIFKKLLTFFKAGANILLVAERLPGNAPGWMALLNLLGREQERQEPRLGTLKTE
jgi:hypothetical protein